MMEVEVEEVARGDKAEGRSCEMLVSWHDRVMIVLRHIFCLLALLAWSEEKKKKNDFDTHD